MERLGLKGYWEWKLRFYYADDVAPPKRPGELAIETVHVGESSRDMELAVGRARPDIGEIDIIDLRPPGWRR